MHNTDSIMERVYVMNPELSNIPVIDRFIGFCMMVCQKARDFHIPFLCFVSSYTNHNIKQSRKT